MPVGWIDRLYNNTDTSWQWSTTDREHNEEIWSGHGLRPLYKLDDGAMPPLEAHTSYIA